MPSSLPFLVVVVGPLRISLCQHEMVCMCVVLAACWIYGGILLWLLGMRFGIEFIPLHVAHGQVVGGVICSQLSSIAHLMGEIVPIPHSINQPLPPFLLIAIVTHFFLENTLVVHKPGRLDIGPVKPDIACGFLLRNGLGEHIPFTVSLLALFCFGIVCVCVCMCVCVCVCVCVVDGEGVVNLLCRFRSLLGLTARWVGS